MKNEFVLVDQDSANDLQSFLQRARRLDPDGMVRVRAFGKILATYVAPIYSGNLMDSGPTVLGLRTCEIETESELDSIVQIAALLDRLARITDVATFGKSDLKVELPETGRAPWAGISPPRSGWTEFGVIAESELTQLAREGIAEVADALPESVGGPIAARIRGEIWGRAIDLESNVPTGAAFVAAGLGFLTEGEEVGIYHTQGWIRLSSQHGHVLAKAATHR